MSNVVKGDFPLNLPISPNSGDTERNSGGNGGDGMEPRITKLESDVEYIKRDIQDIKSDLKEIKKDAKSDFRMLFGVIITTALGLAAIMAKGFGWI